MNNQNTIDTIQIPFSGFYHSIHDSYIDSTIEYYLDEYEGEALEKAQEAFYDMSYKGVHLAVAKHYVQAYNAVFYDKYDIDLCLKFVELDSPRFYNFETDKIFCSYDAEAFKQVVALLDGEKVQNDLLEKYKTRSGFICFQSTIDSIVNKEYEVFAMDLLEMLLPENEVVEDYQYTDNINEVISNAFPSEVWDVLDNLETSSGE